jgi:rare lipoprotein A
MSDHAILVRLKPRQALRRTSPTVSKFCSAIRALVLLTAATSIAACSNSRGSLNDTAPRPQARVNGQSSGFSPSSQGVSASVRPTDGRSTPSYKIGKPYRIGGVWYVPREDPSYDRTGMGSWYGDDFHGRKTANGEIYDMHALTAAHPTLPLPSFVDVTNVGNGKTVRVRVNDRGPYIGGRIIDMSRAAARQLGFERQGKAELRVRYAGRAPLNGDDDTRMASSAPPAAAPITSNSARTALPWSQTASPANPAYGLGGVNPTAQDAYGHSAQEWSTQQHRRALAQQRSTGSR